MRPFGCVFLPRTFDKLQQNSNAIQSFRTSFSEGGLRVDGWVECRGWANLRVVTWPPDVAALGWETLSKHLLVLKKVVDHIKGPCRLP